MRQTILVVDDEEAIRRLLTESLTRAGYRVAAAGSGREALALVEQEPPDLIILDLVMPEMDGIEALRRIRERGVTAKVLILTAYGTAQQIREARALGVREFIGKPFDLDRLVGIVRQELEEDTRGLPG
ncbi:MAG: response regulator [Candidatus Rokubacteria bacterium]|nr:response regulator [Candidatus Rokubacteria bacterium]